MGIGSVWSVRPSCKRALSCFAIGLALGACGDAEPGPEVSAVDPGAAGPELSLERAQCSADADCASTGPCLVGWCDDGDCALSPVVDGSACDDGNPCTTGDACALGSCAATDNVCSCYVDTDCDRYAESDLCAGRFECVDSGCAVIAGTAVTCPPADGCVVSTCDPASGQCQTTVLADGAACSDGDACTSGETCTSGACVGGAPQPCQPEGPCTTPSCDSEVGCVYTPVPDGSLCSDGNPCTEGDSCAGGACASGPNTCTCAVADDCAPFQLDQCAAPLACQAGVCEDPGTGGVVCPAPSDPCAEAVCHPGTGSCQVFPLGDGAACETAAACSVGASCQGGLCVPAEGTCDDGNPCTEDSCDVLVGCTHAALAGGACDDGDPCTADEVCMGGTCVGETLLCDCKGDEDCGGAAFDPCLGAWSCVAAFCELQPGTAPDCGGLDAPPCHVGVCDPATGACAVADAPEGSDCDDGNPCSDGTVCALGACVGGGPAACDDGNPCTNDACQAGVGCKHTFNSAPCDDGNACSANDGCVDGACFGGSVVKCEQPGPCLITACDVELGCVAAPVADGVSCEDGSTCTSGDACQGGVCVGTSICDCLSDADCPDDHDACNGEDSCQGGLCLPAAGSVPVCASISQCQLASCDPATGQCQYKAVADGAFCTDAGPCKASAGTCQAGACQAPDVVCDDGNSCTVDACDPSTGLCVATPVPAAPPCDDGDPCTTGDTCVGGLCAGLGPPPGCEDGDPCTVDACVTGQGCVWSPESCDDGEPCTQDSCDSASGCESLPVICVGDGDPCKVDTCDPATGQCVSGPAPDGQACGESGGTLEACVVALCESGACVASTMSCDDGEPCTEDGCTAGGGCVHSPAAVGSACDDGLPCTSGDVCTVEGACVGAVDAGCDDGDPCTTDTCAADGCAHAPVECVDDDLCTVDLCSADDGQCQHTALEGCVDPVPCGGTPGTACDDGDPVTIADLCLHGICRGFEPGGVDGSAVVGHVVYERVAYAFGQWFVGVAGYDGPLGDGGTLAVLQAGGAPVPAPETVSTALYRALGPGFAADTEGALWVYAPGAAQWQSGTVVGGSYAALGASSASALWATAAPQSEGAWDLWVGGAYQAGGPMVRRCVSDPGAATFGCYEETLVGAAATARVGALTGTGACAGASCVASHLVASTAAGLSDGVAITNELYEITAPYAANSAWEGAGAALAPGTAEVRDVTALGGGRYLAVGTHGYLRHRSASGSWSALLTPFADQGGRHFEAGWAGAGIYAAVAWRSLGAERAFELWVKPLTGAPPASPASWVVYSLGQSSGELSGVFDLDGLYTGSISIVGSAADPDGYAGGLALSRRPQ